MSNEPLLRESNEGQRVEDMRYELGRDAARKGEPLHEGASEEYRHGYTSARWAGGSNVTPKLFGKGNDMLYRDWTCTCGRENKRYWKRCPDCGLNRATAILASETP